jgi:hypothetical protein
MRVTETTILPHPEERGLAHVSKDPSPFETPLRGSSG